MKSRLLASAFLLVLASLAARAADDDNPYRSAKTGDTATYKLTITVDGMKLEGTVTQKVTDKTDKELSMKVTGIVDGKELPEQTQKIDLLLPFDPTKLNRQANAAGLTVEKGKTGTEKLKVDGKEIETTWAEYTVKGNANDLAIKSNMKVWLSKDLTGVLAKMESTMKVGEMEMKITMVWEK